MALPIRSLRLLGFPTQTLDSTSGSTGEIYYDRVAQTIRLYDSQLQGGFTVATRVWVQNNLNTVSQPMTLTDTTNSSSTGTGSLKVFGGAGIAKNLYIGQQLNVTGATTLQSTLALTDDLTVGVNKFTVDAQTGNTVIAGTLSLANDFSIATNKFTVNHTSGATYIAGTLQAANDFSVNSDKFTVNHTTGATTIAGPTQVNSSLTLDANLTLAGATPSIIASATNANIVLTPNGSGYVTISGTNGLVIPKGTTIQQAPAVAGAIRLNTDTNQFEGYSGSNWSSLGGVRSVDNLTYIIAETAPGASDDTLHFYTATGASNNIEAVTISSSKTAILQTTPSTSTITGALTVAGGVGIAGNLYVGGNLNLTGTELAIGSVTFNNGLTLSGSETSATEYFRVTNGSGTPVTKFLVDTANGNTTVSGTADVTGDFKVNTNKFTVAASTGNTVVAGSLTTGDLQVGAFNGGFTVNANTGNVIIQGSLTTYGTSYQVGGGTTISDPLINLHTGTFTSNDGTDIGVFYNYYDTQQRNGFFGRVNSSNYLEYITNATVSAGVFSGTYGTIKAGSYISTGATTIQGNLAIGNITGAAALGNVHISTDSTASVFFDRAGSAPPNMIFRRSNGTTASPTAVTTDNQLFALGGRGYGDTAFSSGGRAAMYAAAAQTWTDSAQGAYLGFTTTPLNSTTAATVLRLESTGQAFFSAGITSTDSTTGTVKVTGGVGISENLNVGGTIYGAVNASSLTMGNTTATSTATPVSISLGGTYSNSAGANPKLRLFADTSSNYIGMGVSSNTLDFIGSNVNYGFKWWTSTTNTMSLDNLGGLTVISLTESSSLALKENISPIRGALDIVKQLEGVTYDRRDGSSKNEAGLIAEAVDKILPNLVKHDDEGNAQGINYTKLTAYLIEAIKELEKKVDQLTR
jgi:hypothetical protein